MFYRTDNISRIIVTQNIVMDWNNVLICDDIPWNIISPIEHRYGYE
jgi:hypothetical protein